jgi:hypothetical protein
LLTLLTVLTFTGAEKTDFGEGALGLPPPSCGVKRSIDRRIEITRGKIRRSV